MTRKIKSHIGIVNQIFFFLLLGITTQSQATIVFYNNEANFMAANSTALSIESFEGFAIGETNITTADLHLSISNTGSNSEINRLLPGAYATQGSNYFGWIYGNDDAISFQFTHAITAFAIDITDLASIGDTTVTFSTDNADEISILFPDFISHGALDFMGIISDTAFTNITLAFSTAEWIGVDRVQYSSAVPVPAAIWLFGTGIVGLLLKRKTKNNPL